MSDDDCVRQLFDHSKSKNNCTINEKWDLCLNSEQQKRQIF